MNQKEKILIYGRNAVEETLDIKPASIREIFLYDGAEESFQKRIRAIASKHSIRVSGASKSFMTKKLGDVVHQGVMAVLDMEIVNFGDWYEKAKEGERKDPIVIIDSLEDVGNVGAIVRSAAAFGIKNIFLEKKKDISGFISRIFKSSAGQVNRQNIVFIGNTNETLRKLKDIGYWSVALDMDGETKLSEMTFDMPTVFVVGKEGEGVPPKTMEICDFRVKIPMKGGVESLNASVSIGIAFYEWSLDNLK